jgi:carbonic anhydrase
VISSLLEGNRRFVEQTFTKEKQYFEQLARQQRPTVLWIGCSDSRVAVNTVTDTRPGEIFVHRNVANVVAPNDWNLSAVLEFSINHLHIPDVVVCGHYGCGGIQALDDDSGEDRYIPIWLINARKAKERVDEKLAALHVELSTEHRRRLIVEENVRLQLEHLGEYPFVRRAVTAGALRTHGWIYDMDTGAIRVLTTGSRSGAATAPP